MRPLHLTAAAALLVPGAAWAQGSVSTRGAALFESYSFRHAASGEHLIYKKISEFTVPIGAEVKLGRRGTFALSTGFAMANLVSDDTLFADQRVSGPLDTETRLSWDLLPGKLVLLATGVVPTGAKTVQKQQLAVLGALSSDVIGFSAPSLGSGGNVGGGFIGAAPLGKFSVGFGGTYKQSLSYYPVAGATPQSLQPGAEIRLRAGLEGGLARRTFLRFATIVARSSNDKIGGVVKNGVGIRIITYLSVNQVLGKASVTAYGFDVLRGAPQIEQTAVGAALLPKGNLLAGGLRCDYPLGQRTTMSPRFEFRTSAAGDTSATSTLQRLGTSFRFGVDARQSLKRGMAAVLQAGGVTGTVLQSGSSIPLSGLRIALSVEYTP